MVGAQARELTCFVLVAFTRQEGRGFAWCRTFELTARGMRLELGEVFALERVVEVARRIDEASVDALHDRIFRHYRAMRLA